MAKAQIELNRAQQEYKRRAALEKTGSVSGEELSNATQSYQAAQATFEAAKIVVSQAQIECDRTNVTAPIDGVIAKRQIEQGQRVQAGYQMMVIVPLQRAYINANLKEAQLRYIKIGQPVKLTSDLYGNSIVYHGKVAGLSGGTGSAFAVIPVQNATGNWVKVVQRLPVRIELNTEELKQHPLQIGLSMNVDIDISGN